MLTYVLCALASFVTVFLKGFQYLNVVHGKYKLAFIFSYLMAMSDVVVITFIAKKGLSMVLPTGLGASLGILLSMWLHRRVAK